jgi:hypothetical protein
MTLRALVTVFALASQPAGTPPSAAAPARAPREITFFVASDTHFGVPGIEEANRRLIDELNGLPGLEYPAEIGGRVGRRAAC